jgi:hypothetical protein
MKNKSKAAPKGVNGKLNIEIRAEQKVRYYTTIHLTQEEWEEFKKLDPSDAAERVTDMLSGDPFDCDTVEDDFEAAVVDEDGERINPIDQYEGGDRSRGAK